MDRDVTHDKPLTLDVTSDVLEEIEILPHSCRFMITRYKTDPAFKLRNHLMHHPCGECDIPQEIDSITFIDQFVIPFNKVLIHETGRAACRERVCQYV